MFPCESEAMPRALSMATSVGGQPTVALGAHVVPLILPAKAVITPLGALRRITLATPSVRYTLPNGSATTLRRSIDPPKMIEVAGHPSPKLSVSPAQLAVAPPAIVVIVYGSGMGLLGSGIIVPAVTVKAIGGDAEPAKLPLAA